jgi:D-glycero-alpha-D-manno-heptose-7-phosphate kinase
MTTIDTLRIHSDYNVVRSRSPLRISFCGGGTDVPPYPEKFGGCVLSCTIDKYAYVSIRPYSTREIHVISDDRHLDVHFEPSGGRSLEGRLDIAQAIFRRFASVGLECHLGADAAPGSGLGSSSSMIVALIEALSRERGITLSKYHKAELAFEIERNDLGIVGGMQDQYAAAFGGFNFIEFDSSGVHVTPLRCSAELLSELHYHLLLCYTGTTRLSGNILAEQTANVVEQRGTVMESLAGIKHLTYALKRALLKGRLLEFGQLLDEAWRLKRKLASAISNAQIEELYETAKGAGAIGGKILGAGGGGHLLLFAPFNKRARVREALEAAGARIVDFQFECDGATSWVTTEETWAPASDAREGECEEQLVVPRAAHV